MTKLLLVRHSEPAWNGEESPSQWKLTERGRMRARLLGEFLDGYEVAAIYSSNEVKAIETAEIAGSVLGITPSSVRDLREHEREETEIIGAAERKALVIEAIRKPGEIIYGSEPVATATSRFGAAVTGLMEPHEDQNVAVVAHGTVISTFVAELLEVDPVPLWESFGVPGLVAIDWPDPSKILDQRNFE